MLLSEHLTASDRLEGVADVLDGRGAAVVGPDEGDDVEPDPLALEEVVLLEEPERRQGEPPLLEGHRLGGLALPPGLHLDEDEDVAVARDQVDLALRRAVAADEDPQAL